MGIRLDWEIEAEQASVQNVGEDRESFRQRWIARLRFLMVVAVVVGLLGVFLGVVYWRLRLIDSQIERSLEDTVAAEVANLRIGDRQAYMEVQRSASEVWLQQQAQVFEDYQSRKRNSDLTLTGRVVDIEVDGTRGRVQVEEIIDGVPYVQTWFYWRYEDGWRHVPQDSTFWGDARTIERDGVRVRFRELDAAVAEAMASAIEGWLIYCEPLACGDVPNLTIEIIPDPGLQLGWAAENPWQLLVPSPYAGVARLDRPFDDALRIEIANLIAERLVIQASGNLQPDRFADANYLLTAVRTWLSGRFAEIETSSYMVSTMTTRYGDATAGQLLANLGTASRVDVINSTVGVNSLAEAELDWRDFLTWRLALEEILIIEQQDPALLLALYDPAGQALAQQRYNTQERLENPVVLISQAAVFDDGTPGLRATVLAGTGETSRELEVLFKLVDGVWKRAS